MFPKVKKVLKKLHKSKLVLWKYSSTYDNNVFKAVFESPNSLLEFYVANMELFDKEKVNTKCIANILLIYKKK